MKNDNRKYSIMVKNINTEAKGRERGRKKGKEGGKMGRGERGKENDRA